MNEGSATHRTTTDNRDATAVTGSSAGPRFAPVSNVLGAELTGADISGAVPETLRAAIADALERHHVLVVRDQKLSDDALIAFAEMFGPVERHYVLNADGSAMSPVHEVSNLDELGNPNIKPFQNSNFFWHSDKSYRAAPTFVTILNPIELPPDGGETQFANLLAAYAALPDDVKADIAGLKAVHSLEHMRTVLDERALSAEEKVASPPVQQPLVRTHPVTREKSLYLGIYCSHVVGKSAEESRALLDHLLNHATQPQFVYTHRWHQGDVIAWDNRWLLHRALPNFEMQKHRRVMRRTVVKGTIPQ